LPGWKRIQQILPSPHPLIRLKIRIQRQKGATLRTRENPVASQGIREATGNCSLLNRLIISFITILKRVETVAKPYLKRKQLMVQEKWSDGKWLRSNPSILSLPSIKDI